MQVPKIKIFLIIFDFLIIFKIFDFLIKSKFFDFFETDQKNQKFLI